jgi:alkylhydroperoxidase family enzyme
MSSEIVSNPPGATPAHAWIPRRSVGEMPAPLADYLAPRIRRLNYLGEMFQVAANAPEVLLQFMHFTDALKEALPFDIGETVVLTVASLMDNRYERHQHERLCLRNGLSRAWLADVTTLRSGALSTPQRAAQSYAIAALATRGKGAHAEFDALAAHFTPAQAIAIAFLVGRYVTHALVVNTLDLEPPVPSVFEDGFDPD